MIMGECPNCDAPVMNAIAPKCPAFSKETCEACNKSYWLKHSRLDPEAYTEEAFLKEFVVDEKTKTLKPKR